jgi:hypothetical protein
MATTYSIQIGTGQYLDSDGVFHEYPAIRTDPTYNAPGGLLPVNMGQISDVLGKVGGSLADLSKVDSNGQPLSDGAKSLIGLGIDPDALEVLGTIANIAKTLALATGIVGAAVSVLSAIISLSSDPNASMKAYLDKLFADEWRLIRGIEITTRKQNLIAQKVKIDGTLTRVDSFFRQELPNYYLTPATLEARLAEIRDLTQQTFEAVLDLADPGSWDLSYDPADYWPSFLSFVPGAQEWPYHHQPTAHLFTNSAAPGTAGADAKWIFPARGSQVFDHRLMVPWVTYAVGSYLTCITALLPEYRTTGTRVPDLRRLAGLVDQLSATMRGSLARVLYTADDFPWVLDRDTLPAGGPVPLRANPNNYNLVGGAMDMCAHTTDYFNHEMTKHEPWPPVPPGTVGNLVVGVIPPVVLGDLLGGVDDGSTDQNTAWVITNPADCVSTTKATADQQYPILLATSGYLGLVQMSALLHHLSAEPINSETVGGQVSAAVLSQQTRQTTATSDPVLFVPGDGIITTAATLVPQLYVARVELTTQPLGRDDRVEYRIVLRTLRWVSGDPPYDDYYESYYVPDSHPTDGSPEDTPLSADQVAIGYYQVASHQEETVLISEYPLTEWMNTPPDTVRASGKKTLTADTFDVYSASQSVMHDAGELGSIGWSAAVFASQPHASIQASEKTDSTPGQDPAMLGRPSETETVQYLGTQEAAGATVAASKEADDAASFGGGQLRHIRREDIDISYEVDWRGDSLHVTVTGDPSQRNFFLFLVVEEKLKPRNPNSTILHSAYRVAVNNQTTLVPPSFFSEEEAAKERAAHVLGDLARRYVHVVPKVGPGDPFTAAINQGDLSTLDGQRRLLELAKQEQPKLLAEVLADNRVE